jgi:caffeoyl-CoA O-methyltransferase
MSDWSPPQLTEYLEGLVPARPAEVVAMEARAARDGFPIIGPACGQWCYLIARLIGARHVFEMGSGFGYSTYWFARAVKENGGGTVHHVEWDGDLSTDAHEYLTHLDLADQVRFLTGEAVALLRAAPGTFDLIFNDIDKEQYPASLPVITDKLRPGGVLITDNVLWGGRVFDPADRAASVDGVREFTRRITADPGWTVALAPVRDGMIIARRY